MSNIDWSQLVTKSIKDGIKISEELSAAKDAESSWRENEMNIIADQLLRIEDGDPSALPGSDSDWRQYRVRVRSWQDGSEGYPNKDCRPKRP